VSLLADAYDRLLTNVQRVQSLVLPNRRGNGIRVNHLNPSYTWRDLEGPIRPKATGAGSPALAVWRGNIRDYSFAANDIVDCTYHIPHDWVFGSDLYIHIHWGHNGTAISGSLVVDYRHSYAKGHDQAEFPADTTLTQTILTPDIATVPRYRHRIDEIQLSSISPSASQIDTNDIEVDGLLDISIKVTTIPTITGGTVNKPFIKYVDIHYLSTNVGTLNKAPDFYMNT
jgi:hypothetical protein